MQQAKEAEWKQWEALRPLAQAWRVRMKGSSSPGTVSWEQTPPSHRGKGADSAKSAQRPHFYCMGTVALWKICQHQNITKLLICKLLFHRLVWEIDQNIKVDIRFQGITMGALQESAKAYLITLFEDTSLCTIHTERKMTPPRDIQLTCRIHGEILYCYVTFIILIILYNLQ